MTQTASPKAPAGIGNAGKALWREIHAALPSGWGFDELELTILALAARQRDDLARLERAIRRDGTMTKGSQGQPVLHPAIAEARQCRSSIERLLRRLEIPEGKAAGQTKPRSVAKEAV